MAKAGTDVCPKCGQSLSSFGAPTTAGETATTLTLQGEIRRLETLHRKNVVRSRLLQLVAGLAVAGLLATGLIYFYSTVLVYAELTDVSLEQDGSAENLISAGFTVQTPGRVSFDRRSGDRRTEKIDVFHQPGANKLAWAWPSEKGSLEFQVVYRQGWSVVRSAKTFTIAGKKGAVDVVFLMDRTTSMGPYIKGLKERCIDFANVLQKGGLDCRLGLISFGDLRENEAMDVKPLTEHVQEFQTWVSKLKLTGGGDSPESSLDAVLEALNQQYRSQTPVVFVLITDADSHGAERVPRIRSELKQRGIITYVVSQTEQQNRYDALCVNGGKFFAMEQARFEDLLDNLAKSVSSTIGYQR